MWRDLGYKLIEKTDEYPEIVICNSISSIYPGEYVRQSVRLTCRDFHSIGVSGPPQKLVVFFVVLRMVQFRRILINIVRLKLFRSEAYRSYRIYPSFAGLLISFIQWPHKL